MFRRTLETRYGVSSVKELLYRANADTDEALKNEGWEPGGMAFTLKFAWETIKNVFRRLAQVDNNPNYFQGAMYIRVVYEDILSALLKANAISPKEHALLTKGFTTPSCFFIYGKEYQVADLVIRYFRHHKPYQSILMQLYVTGFLNKKTYHQFSTEVDKLDRYLSITNTLCFREPVLSTGRYKITTMHELESLCDPTYCAS